MAWVVPAEVQGKTPYPVQGWWLEVVPHFARVVKHEDPALVFVLAWAANLVTVE